MREGKAHRLKTEHVQSTEGRKGPGMFVEYVVFDQNLKHTEGGKGEEAGGLAWHQSRNNLELMH